MKNAKNASDVLMQMPLAVISTDEAGNLTGWNHKAGELFGYAEADVLGKSADTLLHSDSPIESIPYDIDSPMRLSGRHQDGHAISCEWRISPLKSDSGDVTGHVLLVRDDVGAPAEKSVLQLQAQGLLRSITQGPALVLWAADREGKFTLSEGRGLESMGLAPGQVVGLNAFDLYAGNDKIIDSIRRALQGAALNEKTFAGNRYWDSNFLPLADQDGNIVGVVGLAWDITERIETEQALQKQLDVVAKQESVIRTLSTAIVRVWKEVLALPLVGTIDADRAERIMAALLEAVVKEQAQYVIVDMTGIQNVDTLTAEHLFRVLRAVGLLGANAIVTGINPGVAQTMVDLGVDLGSLMTLSNLEEALRFVMTRKERAFGTTPVGRRLRK